MWRASLQQYRKHVAYSNRGDKHYRPIFLNIPDDNFPYYGRVAMRESRRKLKRVSDVFEYADRFNKRVRGFLMRQANTDVLHAGHGKFIWNKSSLLHTFLWRGEKLRRPHKILIEREVQLADVSLYQGQIDWAKFTLPGAIIKAGQRNYPDPRFATNWANARVQGVPRGSYWFYDSRQEPKYQAALWASLIAADPGELLHCADYEETYGGPYGGPGHFRAFLEEFQRLSKLPDNRIAIYTGYYYWIAHSPTTLTELQWFRRFELWLAWYTTDPSVVRIPQPWDNSRLILWQWTSSGDGYAQGMESAELDLNWFNGTLETYNTRFGTNTVPPNGGTIMKCKMLGYTVNVRDAGGVVVAALRVNDVVYGEVFNDGRERVRFSKIYRASGTIENMGGVCTAVTNDGATLPKYYMVITNEPEPGTEPPPKVALASGNLDYNITTGELTATAKYADGSTLSNIYPKEK